MDGMLREVFIGVAAKRLSAVEADRACSNQHEINGVAALKLLLGPSPQAFQTRYLYIQDGEDGPSTLEATAWAQWYDARAAHPTRSEYRLYFPSTEPMNCATEGDLCFIALDHIGTLTIIVADGGSNSGRRLDRLFKTDLAHLTGEEPFKLVSSSKADDRGLDVEDVSLLETLGITPAVEHEDLLDQMVQLFGGTYPPPDTAHFTQFARSVCEVDPRHEPDLALTVWFETTTDLFFAYERHILQPILDSEFAGLSHIDVDRFFAVATRFKNSRFSRSGASFEHHIAALFDENDLNYFRPRKKYLDGAKPDFVLPSDNAYLTGYSGTALVAAKTTTKERWRQVATEGRSVRHRFLATMDRHVTETTADDMALNGLRLVIPADTAPHLGVLDYQGLIDELRFLQAKSGP